MSSVETLLQYLFQGDLFGFLEAVYVSAFMGFGELFYGLLTLMLLLPQYIRGKSLLFISMLWILIGTLFLVAMPMVSTIALLMMVLGIGGILFRVFLKARSDYG